MSVLGPEEAELKALESAFKAEWDALTYPYVLGDDPFKGERTKPWVRFSILPGKGDRQDLGSSSPRRQFPGVLTVQCFIPQQGEVSPQWIAADINQRIAEIFDDEQFVTDTSGHIVCQTTSYQRVPAEASWQRFNVITPYTRYEVSS